MGMTVTLYQGCKVNGSSRMGLWANLIDQKNYFDSLSRNVINTGTVKLGEPLRLNLSVNDIMTYDYGNIDYGDGFRYYFTISNVEMVTESISDVYYNIDAYETLVMQKPFAYGRALIRRYPSRIGKPSLTYEPNVVTGYTRRKFGTGLTWTFIALAWDSVNNTYKTVIIPDTNTKGISIQDIFNGDWYSVMSSHYPDLPLKSDIITNALIPSGIYISQYSTPVNDTMVQPLMNPALIVKPSEFLHLSSSDNRIISSDETKLTVIKDERGNDIFTVPIGHSYTISDDPAYILLNVSTISVELTYTYGNDTDYIKVPCESVSWVVDSFAEYNARQRMVDVETRKLQNEKALVDGLANAVVSAGSGAVMGSIGGGAGAGAIAGGLSAVGGAVTSFIVNDAYAKKEQDIIDKSYRYANDYLINMGNFSYGEYAKAKQGIYEIYHDSDIANQNDIAVNGYPVSFPVDSFNSYITTGKIQADVEILNISNQAWKEQIQNRFANGVMIV